MVKHSTEMTHDVRCPKTATYSANHLSERGVPQGSKAMCPNATP